MSAKTMTIEAWRQEAADRFGPDPLLWRFVCPSCGHVAAVIDWQTAGAPEGAVAFSCIGRYTGDPAAAAAAAFKRSGGPCNYTCGGLLNLADLMLDLGDGKTSPAFEVAPDKDPDHA